MGYIMSTQVASVFQNVSGKLHPTELLALTTMADVIHLNGRVQKTSKPPV